MVESSIFDKFTSSGDDSGDLDFKTELREQVSQAEKLQQSLKSLQKFKIFDPLTSKENPVHMERSKLDDLLKRTMMQQSGLALMRIIRGE